MSRFFRKSRWFLISCFHSTGVHNAAINSRPGPGITDDVFVGCFPNPNGRCGQVGPRREYHMPLYKKILRSRWGHAVFSAMRLDTKGSVPPVVHNVVFPLSMSLHETVHHYRSPEMGAMVGWRLLARKAYRLCSVNKV